MTPTLTRYLGAFRSPKGIVGTALFGLLVLIALLAPVLWPGGYDQQTGDALTPASLAHPFGTDELGRDIFTRSIFGLRTDVSLVLLAVPLSMAVGTLLGLLGAIAEWLGNAAQRLLDIVIGFPSLILGICVVLILGAGWLALFIAIVIYGLPAFGRLARAAWLSQQEREYVQAARVLGVGRSQVMVRHILPNALDPILVQGAVFTVSAIFIESALSIVGLGIQPPQPSLGALLNTGLRYIHQAPAYILGPTVLLLLLALAFTLLADALNEAVLHR